MAVVAHGQARDLARDLARKGARVFSVGALPQRLANAFLPTGAIWFFGAGVLLFISLVTPWLQVPLVNAWTSWLIPIDLGWGVHSNLLSYGVLVTVIACFFFWRGGRVTDWPALAPAGRRSGAVTRPRSLVWMALLALTPVALAMFQLLFVGYNLMATLQDDENQYLLLTRHLGYTLLAQHFPLQIFQFSINGTLDRLALVVELAGAGMITPLLAGALCLVGAYFSRPGALATLAPLIAPLRGGAPTTRASSPQRGPADAHASLAAPTAQPPGAPADEPPGETRDDVADASAVDDHGLNWRRWRRWRGPLIAAAVVVGLIIFGRAPAGLYAKSQGLAALNQGRYQTALNDFGLATTLTPSLEDLPHFHEERGEALYMLGDTNTLDAGLYLASQYTTIYAPDQAWAVERELLRSYPTSAPLHFITARSLELLVEKNTKVAITPTDDEEEALNPQVTIAVAQVDQALPWLDRLLILQPGNVYALYMHGRVLYSARSYESAGSDFLALAHESHDANMQSAAYTYVALCYAGVGNFTAERSYLQLAVELDYDYNNTTARETASGLH